MELKEEIKIEIEELIKNAEVNEMPPEDLINEALNGDYKKQWKVFKVLEGNKEFSMLKDLVKNGISKGFNMNFAVKDDWVQEYPNSHRIKLQGYKKFKLEDFHDEIAQREAIMTKILWNGLGGHPDNQE